MGERAPGSRANSSACVIAAPAALPLPAGCWSGRAAQGAGSAGGGRLRAERVLGRNTVTERTARYPLRFLFLRGGQDAAVWAYAVTFGGGLTSADLVACAVEVGPGAALVLGTQSSTKVFRARCAGEAARLEARLLVAAGALLASCPQPVTCFRGSRLEQRTQVRLERGGSLVLVDWLSCGRAEGYGEVWAMDWLRSSISLLLLAVAHDGAGDEAREAAAAAEPLLLDDVLLCAADGAAAQMDQCRAFATVLLAGPRVVPLLPLAGAARLRPGLCVSCATVASPDHVPGGVVVLRIAAAAVETVQGVLAELLLPLAGPLGGELYAPVPA
jgi:urease accessory protein UreH